MFPSFRSLGGVKNEMLLHSTIVLKHRIITHAIGKSLIFMVVNPDFTGGDSVYHKAINIFICLPGTVAIPVHQWGSISVQRLYLPCSGAVKVRMQTGTMPKAPG